MLASKIGYLTLEEGKKIHASLDSIYFHQFQDPYRSFFVEQPCFTCTKNGKVIAFAVIEMHRFRKASVWLGPVFLDDTDKNLIWPEFFKQLRKFKINHLTLQTEKQDVFESAHAYVLANNGPKLIRLHWGMSTAIKKLEGTEDEIFKSYNKHHQKEVVIARKKEIAIKPVATAAEFDKLVDLFLLMFQQIRLY